MFCSVFFGFIDGFTVFVLCVMSLLGGTFSFVCMSCVFAFAIHSHLHLHLDLR